ncbi:universal stress protein [Alcanivorax sp.]|uniref:universal stress protein n=1 Tax=Alcanivorax sp. TaxID=1872427 RepID=UPI0032D99433
MTAPVVAILDRSLKANQPALNKAQRIAAASSAPLHIIVNAYSSAMVRAVGLDTERQQGARQQISSAWHKRITELLGEDTGEVRVLWEKDSMDGLRKTILALSPSLVVVHTSDDSALRRHLFTPRDWQLIRKAPCPVLCVHSREWNAAPRILAALDPGTGEACDDRLSVRILEGARQQAALLGANLTACHVLDEMDEGLIMVAGEAIPDYTGSMEKVRAFHRDNFFQFGAAQGLDKGQLVTLNGPIAHSLSDYCDKEDVDLLVLGTVHRNLPERLLLGSTAESVITRANADVLVIKPEGFQSPWNTDDDEQ